MERGKNKVRSEKDGWRMNFMSESRCAAKAPSKPIRRGFLTTGRRNSSSTRKFLSFGCPETLTSKQCVGGRDLIL